MAPASEAPRDKLDSVQLMRAIAALAVVTQHIPNLFGNGTWGVDLFFVISGFIMCFVTAKSSDFFFRKRIIRVVPLYWAGTIVAYLVAVFKPSLVNNTTTDVTLLLKSLAFIPYQKGPLVSPILFLGWTLNYEMLFYLLFAASAATSQRYRALICSAMICAIVLAGHIFQFQAVVPAFYTSDMLLEFVFGMACYAIYSALGRTRSAEMSGSLRTWLAVIGFLLIACMLLTTSYVPIVGRVVAHGILAAFAFLFLLYGLSNRRLPIVLVMIGDASYSLYLFHPYILQFLKKVTHSFDVPDVRSYAIAVFAVAFCCLMSLLSYRFLEHPVTERLRRLLIAKRPRGPVLQIGGADSSPLGSVDN